MTPGARQLFIYYRVDPSRAEAVQAAVRGMQQRLRDEHPGLHAALLQRPGTPQRPELTFMETYAVDADVAPHGVSEAVAAHIEALAAALGVERHVEVFTACA